MMNTFEHNKNLLKSINTFNLLEKTRYNAPRDKKQITHILMKKNKRSVILLLFISSLFLSSCYLLKDKNKCNTCPNFNHTKKR